MPFTLAHPAAVLPLRRTALPFSALVVGSMSPDFEYILRLRPDSAVSHSLAGVFLFCVPASLGVLWLAHRLWRRPLLALSRERERADVDRSTFAFWPPGRLALVGAAIVVGALTHLAWDSFTHGGGWMVEHVPALATQVLPTRWEPLTVFKLLQHGSSLFGLTVLAWAVRRNGGWRRWASVVAARPVWGTALLVCAASLAMALASAWGHSGFTFARRLAATGVLTCFALALVTTTAYGVYWHAVRRTWP